MNIQKHWHTTFETLSPHCTQWTHSLIGAQYLLPFKIVQKYHASQKKVLDWGCGDGHFSHFLCHKGYDVEAFSLEPPASFSMRPLLEQRFGNRFHFTQGTPDNPVSLPYDDETFDSVYSVGVLEHVRETEGNELSSLKELHRILKAGKTLFVFHFPNRYSWIETMNRATQFLRRSPKYTHPYLYTLEDIQTLASNAGFDLIEHGLYNLLPRNLFRKLPPSFGNHPLPYYCYQALERTFSLFLKRFSQNHYFVLSKKYTPLAQEVRKCQGGALNLNQG